MTGDASLGRGQGGEQLRKARNTRKGAGSEATENLALVRCGALFACFACFVVPSLRGYCEPGPDPLGLIGGGGFLELRKARNTRKGLDGDRGMDGRMGERPGTGMGIGL